MKACEAGYSRKDTIATQTTTSMDGTNTCPKRAVDKFGAERNAGMKIHQDLSWRACREMQAMEAASKVASARRSLR